MSGTVLIVDDDAAIRTVAAAAHKREGPRVTTAARSPVGSASRLSSPRPKSAPDLR